MKKIVACFTLVVPDEHVGHAVGFFRDVAGTVAEVAPGAVQIHPEDLSEEDLAAFEAAALAHDVPAIERALKVEDKTAQVREHAKAAGHTAKETAFMVGGGREKPEEVTVKVTPAGRGGMLN